MKCNKIKELRTGIKIEREHSHFLKLNKPYQAYKEVKMSKELCIRKARLRLNALLVKRRAGTIKVTPLLKRNPKFRFNLRK